jgi:uncharacterized protein YbaR (Trm112 family)
MAIDPVLLALLACPVDHARLEDRTTSLHCVACGRAYPIQDGIPVLLADAAEPR